MVHRRWKGSRVAARKKIADLEMVWMDRDELVPYPSNPKSHPDSQISQIMASIQQFGFINPILIDAKGVVIAGHGRLEAAGRLGLEKVRVIRVDHLTEDQARALRVADNAIPEGGAWNAELLDIELGLLRNVKFDIVSLGLEDIKLPEIEEPVVAPPKASRSKTTIFVSVRNEDVVKARKAIVSALDKAKIAHNL